MEMTSVKSLMTTGLSYVLDFEEKLAKAAPGIAEASSDAELKDMFSKTATKSTEYAERVKAVYEKLGEKLEKNENHLAVAMIKEVEGMVSKSEQGPVRDAALIVAANQQQAYRVASYGSLMTYAKLLKKQDAVSDLQKSLEESKAGDEKFTKLAESKVNQAALQAA